MGAAEISWTSGYSGSPRRARWHRYPPHQYALRPYCAPSQVCVSIGGARQAIRRPLTCARSGYSAKGVRVRGYPASAFETRLDIFDEP